MLGGSVAAAEGPESLGWPNTRVCEKYEMQSSKGQFFFGGEEGGKGEDEDERFFFAVESVKCGRGSEAAGGGML